MTALEQAQAKLAALTAEADKLPDLIRQAMTADGDGRKLAALMARREALAVQVKSAEQEVLTLQLAEVEAEYAATVEEHRQARQKAIEADQARIEAAKAADIASGEAGRLHARLYAIKTKIQTAKERLSALEREVESILAGRLNPRRGLNPRP
jgi:chromosome segregation ATPase